MNKKKYADTAERAASKERLEFEKFLADLSAKFVSLHPEQVDNEINDAKNEMGTGSFSFISGNTAMP